MPVQTETGTLTEVMGFGRNPSGLAMHLYVPTRIAGHPAILVAVHNCTSSGPAFFEATEYASLADRYGFIVIYPTATRPGSCFDVSSPETLLHDGGSDSAAIVAMVGYVTRHGGDADRVYVTGASSGAMMTNVLLGAYPDVFRAGAPFMGVPFGCFATFDGSSWNSACADGEIVKTGREWGDLVRAAYPGFDGPRPRVQLWHGTEDEILRYPNLDESVKQWTDVHGTGERPCLVDHPEPGWTRTRYGTSDAGAPVEAISLQGTGHDLPASGMAERILEFFGLTQQG